MLKRKKILSKLLATTMVLTSFTVNASAAEVNSDTILGGSNRFETAIKISENGWSTSDRAVLINGEKGLVDALTATPYAYTKNAPILITASGKLTPATANRLTKMGVKNVDVVGGTNSVSEGVVTELKNKGITVNRISGASRYDTSLAVAKELDKIQDVAQIAVVNGDKGIPDAVSVAAPAASKKMPILLAENNGLNAASKKFVDGEGVTKSYVIGSTNSVSDGVMNSLPGTKTRLGGANRHDTNAAVIKEFYTATSLSNIYVAKSGMVKSKDEIVDALSAGVLAARNGNPIVLVGNNLETSQQSLLASKKFTKMTQIGMGIPTNSVNQIKATQAEVEATVSSVTVVDGNTLKVTGNNLGLIDKSKVDIADNTIRTYTPNSTGTEVSVVFNKEFNNGTNKVKITSNLGKVTEHQFTYKSSLTDITNVKGFTTEVGAGTLATLELSVNGNNFATKVRDLKKQGWTVEFKSNSEIFLNNENTSSDGRLKTLTNGSNYEYEVKITKGDKSYTNLTAFKVVNKADTYKSIKGIKLFAGIAANKEIELKNNTLILNEEARIGKVIVENDQGNTIEVNASEFTITSSKPEVIFVKGGSSIKSAGNIDTSILTIKSGDKSLNVPIAVVDKTRDLSSVSIDTNSTLKLMTGVTGESSISVKDNVSDPYNGVVINSGTKIMDSETGKTEIAEVIGNVESDANGIATVKIKGKAKGSGKLMLKNATINVYIDTNVAPTKWKLVVDKGEKTDLDLYTPNKDNKKQSVELKLVGENDTGYSSGEIANPNISYTSTVPTELEKGKYVIYSNNDSAANVSTSNNEILLKANEKASSKAVTITVYKGSDENKPVASNTTISVNVSDSRPKATDIELGYVDRITTKVTSFDVVDSLFDIRSGEVNCLKISGVTEKVLLGDNGTDPVFYINKNEDDIFSSEDVLLARIVVDKTFAGGSIINGKVTLPDGAVSGEILVTVYLNGSNQSKLVERIAVDVK